MTRKEAIQLVNIKVTTLTGGMMNVNDLPDTVELCEIYDTLDDPEMTGKQAEEFINDNINEDFVNSLLMS